MLKIFLLSASYYARSMLKINFYNCLFPFLSILERLTFFSHVLTFVVRGVSLTLVASTFAKFVKFLKCSTVEAGLNKVSYFQD